MNVPVAVVQAVVPRDEILDGNGIAAECDCHIVVGTREGKGVSTCRIFEIEFAAVRVGLDGVCAMPGLKDIDVVCIIPAFEDVVACSADEDVATRVPLQDVVACPACEGIAVRVAL